MDHRSDFRSFKTYLLSTESFQINKEINNDPKIFEEDFTAIVRGTRLDNTLNTLNCGNSNEFVIS